MARRRVGIIGAGPAGIVALKTFLNPPSNYDIVIFEKTSRVGGIWNYDKYPGPMYQNLRTNLPIPLMEFRDFPCTQKLESSFPTHRQVLSYINDYLDSFNGRDYIQFDTLVKDVAPITGEDGGLARWKMSTSSKGKNSTYELDFVLVCNGHYEVPASPAIRGLDNFPGKVIHSYYYSVPEVFANKKILLLGARSSGQDIALDLSLHASQVVMSHGQGPLPTALPSNVSQVASVVAYEDSAFVCEDGTRVEDVDVFLLCTGYEYDFPFLDKRCGVSVIDGRCHPVWKHIVNIEHHSMFFIGLCQLVSPNPLFEMQCHFVRAITDGHFVLPSKEEMFRDLSAEYDRKVTNTCRRPRYLHCMIDDQWLYNDQIAELAGCAKLPRYLGDMYAKCSDRRRNELMNYRNFYFKVLSDDEFELSLKN